ncbi:hypothetical protein AB9G23_04645 [Francisella philomiragia]|uniref:hypothetical protein n=1 Tax=Francisella philomiragia TaxID=28110 RepID=UPI00190424D4|nr:hypothetical protein [Francisella philomiragia]MBK2026162.1 hypothetical protein [Francisella philomiragia]
MENKKSDISNLNEIRNIINNLPKEAKEELKSKGFDINNEQRLRDSAKLYQDAASKSKLSL